MKKQTLQPEAKAGLKPEAQPEPKPEAQPEAQPEQAATPEPGSKSEPESKPKPGAKPEPEPEAKPDIEALIAEAEQRGYIRGCNERIANLMEQPGPWQSQPPEPQDDNDGILILNNLRPSVWDK